MDCCCDGGFMLSACLSGTTEYVMNTLKGQTIHSDYRQDGLNRLWRSWAKGQSHCSFMLVTLVHFKKNKLRSKSLSSISLHDLKSGEQNISGMHWEFIQIWPKASFRLHCQFVTFWRSKVTEALHIYKIVVSHKNQSIVFGGAICLSFNKHCSLRFSLPWKLFQSFFLWML